MYFTKIKTSFHLIFFIFFTQLTYSQEVKVIDNKGTIITVNNNKVTLSNTSPSNSVEGDVWFDTTDGANIVTKIYDGTTWQLVNTKVNLLQDADGDTTIKVEQNADEDIIRFNTGNTNANRKILRIDNPGLFSGLNTNSAVFGLEANGSNLFDGRLRITSGNNDTFDDSQGASLDLHGNNTSFSPGKINLIAGSSASGANIAFSIWGNDGEVSPTSSERFVVTGKGNIGIGNSLPNSNAILDLTNSQKFAFVLPSETDPTEISSPINAMVVFSSNNNNAYLRANDAWKPLAYNSVTNELIFDGDDDASTANDNYRYVSLVINGDWKVIRYDKTDVNVEDIANVANNPSQTTQPLTLAECSALTF